ncbi:nucleotidyl transferase AbiEii/AbiGii toxin family protein [Agromyces archimandritae]|uniref:nucleotidyl transferase AbiEii/AbiGii toxin family protein n=1 Tax=Agromyces archimandritae TaxID=2781962 RepID=UPI001FD5C22A|nr:nucleotidyl transferase AbiEii/AbiGii toxin family protein [Agromyces archimandritae]
MWKRVFGRLSRSSEKIVTAIDRGEQNTQWRDFVDIVAVSRSRSIDTVELRHALTDVAAHRGISLEPLGPLLVQMPDLAQARWAAWRRKQRLTDSTPEQFGELIAECTSFVDGILGR